MLQLARGAGEWRGLPVALKTLVFEAEHLPLGPPGAPTATGKGQRVQKHNQAIMEAALAASLGHRNVVS